jgi:hypothetical protein
MVERAGVLDAQSLAARLIEARKKNAETPLMTVCVCVSVCVRVCVCVGGWVCTEAHTGVPPKPENRNRCMRRRPRIHRQTPSNTCCHLAPITQPKTTTTGRLCTWQP